MGNDALRAEQLIGERTGQAHPDAPAPQRTFRHLLAVPWFYRLGFEAGRRVPLPVLYGVADVLGMATYLTCRAPARTLRANLTRLLPDAPDSARARLARPGFVVTESNARGRRSGVPSARRHPAGEQQRRRGAEAKGPVGRPCAFSPLRLCGSYSSWVHTF